MKSSSGSKTVTIDSPPALALELLSQCSAQESQPVLLRNLPEQLRNPDLLLICEHERLLQIVCLCHGVIATANEVLGISKSWGHYSQSGFHRNLEKAIEQDSARSPDKGLHLRLTRNGVLALAKHRLNGATPVTADFEEPERITIAVAVSDYQVTARTIRRALKEGRLKDYRRPGAKKNSPMILDRKQVAGIWPPRPGRAATG